MSVCPVGPTGMREDSHVSEGDLGCESLQGSRVALVCYFGRQCHPRDLHLLLPSTTTLTAQGGASVGLCQSQHACLPATLSGSAEISGVVSEPTGFTTGELRFKGQRVLVPTSLHSGCSRRGSGVSGVILRSKPVSNILSHVGSTLASGHRSLWGRLRSLAGDTCVAAGGKRGRHYSLYAQPFPV